MQRWGLMIDGRKVATDGFQDVINPSTGDVVGAMPLATSKDLDTTVVTWMNAMIWSSMKRCEVAGPIHGFGKLLASL